MFLLVKHSSLPGNIKEISFLGSSTLQGDFYHIKLKLFSALVFVGWGGGGEEPKEEVVKRCWAFNQTCERKVSLCIPIIVEA